MKVLDPTKALETGWHTFRRSGWYLVALTAAVLVLGTLALNDAMMTALYSIILGGYIILLLKHARQEEYTFDDVFLIDQRWIHLAFSILIKTFLISVGLLCLVVPGVYLIVRWMFSELYVLDKGMRPIESLKASSELTVGYRWDLFFYFLFVILIIGIIGVLAYSLVLLLMISTTSLIGFAVSIALVIFVSSVVVPFINLANIALFWKLQELQYLNGLEQE